MVLIVWPCALLLADRCINYDRKKPLIFLLATRTSKSKHAAPRSTWSLFDNQELSKNLLTEGNALVYLTKILVYGFKNQICSFL